MGKNKAMSTDGMLDIIFQEEEWKMMKFEGEYSWYELDEDRTGRIRYTISRKLQDYLNYVLTCKTRLPE